MLVICNLVCNIHEYTNYDFNNFTFDWRSSNHKTLNHLCPRNNKLKIVFLSFVIYLQMDFIQIVIAYEEKKPD